MTYEMFRKTMQREASPYKRLMLFLFKKGKRQVYKMKVKKKWREKNAFNERNALSPPIAVEGLICPLEVNAIIFFRRAQNKEI